MTKIPTSSGDQCDADKDNDGILNQDDNCPLIYNPDQTDVDRKKNAILLNSSFRFIILLTVSGNGIGDICEDDYDADKVPNYMDNCPNNSKIFSTDFTTYQTVVLDPEGESQIDPHWVNDKENFVKKCSNAEMVFPFR